ncbi:DUF2784 domain-containing protein [Variovorax sp. PCZ-1]|uniref:DUF2784 domain-containing protein n=1 Tax=Variovorax sp. PCZ-1 TaxID=2835533 RepID=UPI001BD076FF|nr:DUF2784 domain-containing protein [Variovorax sp. PCZ-1]MBS7806589.1 DUF2784 domain-containing protein [Variovorax sp. PCZ-1]
MNPRLLADAVLLFHGLFILFAVFGGIWVNWRQPIRKLRLILHLACAAWAATVVIMGYTCPLTPLEQNLRIAAGQQGYKSSFIEHYLLAAIYPDGLTRPIQIALGLCVVAINALAYGVPWFFRRKEALARTE